MQNDLFSLVGQENLKRWFKREVQNGRMHHALAFVGPEGLGKKSFAMAFAKFLLCETVQQNFYSLKGQNEKVQSTMPICEACNRCVSCETFATESNPDFEQLIHEKQRIGVDDIRRIQRQLYIKPMYGNRKICFIDEAQNLTEAAQNALLKMIEEPPNYLTFIFTTTNFQQFLQTMQSRILKQTFSLYQQHEILEILDRNFGKDSQHTFIAHMSQGNVGDAMALKQDDNKWKDRLRLLGKIEPLLQKDEEALLAFVDEISEKKEKAERTLLLFSSILRDLILIRYPQLERLIVNQDQKEWLGEQANRFNEAQNIQWNVAVEEVLKGLAQNVNLGLATSFLGLHLRVQD